jgi:hypothetical protein
LVQPKSQQTFGGDANLFAAGQNLHSSTAGCADCCSRRSAASAAGNRAYERSKRSAAAYSLGCTAIGPESFTTSFFSNIRAYSISSVADSYRRESKFQP